MSESPARLPGVQEILEALPHRYPFLLVDKILEIESGKRIVAIKNVSFNEPHFTGHFPENPIMPGVLIAEALAQAGAIAMLGMPEYKGKIAVLTGIDGAKFRRLVKPGDQLRLEVEIDKIRRGFGKSAARATVNGELAAEMQISFAVVDREQSTAAN
ncbi:MAG: 3-hydroxyacyl-(acyl-carrier-protein) dehydratase FabZ [candidate division BRC1 bacterium ADurb.BinA364]|nr:MAG: 3-hydroxyacyl-(acyl-carrier-protein) dehydratase FabZ [candidate division BRC1 bacterium ADurb.BinA364]